MPSFQKDERVYKLELAERLRDARDLAASQDDGWFDAVCGAVSDPANNLTQWQVHDSFLRWLRGDRAGGLTPFTSSGRVKARRPHDSNPSRPTCRRPPSDRPARG